MRDVVLALIIFGSLPFVLIRPHVGVLVWSWLSYMNPHRFAWGFAYDFRFALIVGGATIAAWLISREPKRIAWSASTVLLLLFALWISFTTLFADFPDHAQDKWTQTMKIIVFNGFVTLGLMRTRERLDLLIWVIAVSIGFYGIKGGLFTLLTGGQARVFGPEASFIADNNAFAMAMLMTVPLMRYLQLQARRTWVKWGLGIAMLLSVVAVLGSHSRGGLVGLLVMASLLLLRTRRRVLVGLALIATVVLGATFMPEHWWQRMETIAEYQEDASVQGRFRAWGFALDRALERPLVGGGFETFRGNADAESSVGYRNAHSIYFEVLGEHGFLGLAFYLSLLAATLLLGAKALRRCRPRQELGWAQDLLRMTQVSLLTFLTAGAFLNLAYFDLFCHTVVLTILAAALATEALAAREEPMPAGPVVRAPEPSAGLGARPYEAGRGRGAL